MTISVEDGFLILLGASMVISGCIAKEFYFARGMRAGSSSRKRAPVWFGRLMLIGPGLALILRALRQALSK
jgi:hypothetical protein